MKAAGTRATESLRARNRALGLARIEVQAPAADATLIRAVAEVLRGEPEGARVLRDAISAALPDASPASAFDIFGSELSDEVFEDVFDQPRTDRWREVDL